MKLPITLLLILFPFNLFSAVTTWWAYRNVEGMVELNPLTRMRLDSPLTYWGGYFLAWVGLTISWFLWDKYWCNVFVNGIKLLTIALIMVDFIIDLYSMVWIVGK